MKEKRVVTMLTKLFQFIFQTVVVQTRRGMPCPCNILQYFTAIKMIIFSDKFLIFFLFLFKTLIVGTR